MSSPKRRDTAGLIDQLLADPHRFEFFQAVRLLEHALVEKGAAGKHLPPREIRFRNSLSLSFPSSEIESLVVHRSTSGEVSDAAAASASIQRLEITPAFMGLLGASGALPLVYTEQIAQRELYQRDLAARAFLDLFSHRAVALFYAAWKKSRLQLQYETDRQNHFAPMALALAGLGQTSLNQRLQANSGGVHDESLAFFAGAIHRRNLSAGQLQQVLERHFGVPVQIEQFRGRWYRLPAPARTTLGASNGVLGRNALAGDRVWQRDLRVKMVMGPLTQATFRRFLPGGAGAIALRELLALVSGVSLEYEINLTLRADAVHSSELRSARSPMSGRLGWDTYLQTRPQLFERCDVRYDVLAAAA